MDSAGHMRKWIVATITLYCVLLAVQQVEAMSPPSPANQNHLPFKPFFRPEGKNAISLSNPELPAPPKLTSFDKAVLNACGPWGSFPTKQDFLALLQNHSLAKDVHSIYDRLNHQIITPNSDINTFKNELTQAWFSHNAFRHIFCGEPEKRVLGGLHFVGRYLEAQEKGWAGIATHQDWRSHCDGQTEEEIEPPIYTMATEYFDSNGNLKTKCMGGYDFNLNALDTLVLGTKALKAFKSVNGRGMCLYQLPDGRFAVFVKANNSSIITFYTDATPKCNFGKKHCDCK